MKNNKDINDKIKSYEPLMHRVLHNYNVKEDYEDLFQEMSIIVWKAIVNINPRTMYINNNNTKFTTYLYRIMENKLINIFKVQYKIKTAEEISKESLNKKIQRNLVKPRLFEDMSFEQQVNALRNSHDANSIRLKTDIDTFCSTLDDFEKKVWALNVEGWSQKEISKKLEKENIFKNRSTISRKLKIINNKFTKFIENGEL